MFLLKMSVMCYGVIRQGTCGEGEIKELNFRLRTKRKGKPLMVQLIFIIRSLFSSLLTEQTEKTRFRLSSICSIFTKEKSYY